MVSANWGVGNLGRVQLVDIDGVPYTAQFVNQVVDGGEIDTSTLATESTQAEIVQRLDTLALQQQEARPVVVENPEMPLPTGASTSNLQTTQINRLNDVYALLGSGISVILENDEALNVAVSSLPLPSGASTSAKQDALLAALQAGVSVNVANALSAAITSLPPVQIAANQSLGVTGTVNIGNTVPVSGSVNVGNFPTTQPVSGTVAVSSIGTPVPITDNGQSITVDGSVAVSGPVEISNFPATQPVSVASVPVHGVTQSGAWTVGVNNYPETQAVSLTSVPTHPVTQSGTWSTSISNFPATQPVSGTVTANLGAPGTGATSLGKAEDAAHASGDTGIATWGVRNDGGTTALTSANGDYSPQAVDNAGSTWVRNRPAISSTVTNVATSTTSATLAAADANRLSVIIHNSGTADLLVKYGPTASATSFTTRIVPAGTMGVDSATWAGVIDCVAATGTGTARVTVMS